MHAVVFKNRCGYISNVLYFLIFILQIILDDDDIRDHKATTVEIKECCKDIKVLGKTELKWVNM